MKIERPKTIVESYDLQNTKPGTVVTLPDDVEGHVFIVARNMRPQSPYAMRPQRNFLVRLSDGWYTWSGPNMRVIPVDATLVLA